MMMSMSQSLGMNMTPEDAAKAHEAMSSVSADDLDRLVRLAFFYLSVCCWTFVGILERP